MRAFVWTFLGALAAADAFLLWPEAIPETEPFKPYVADLASLMTGGDKKHQVLSVACHKCIEPGETAFLVYDFKISNMKGEKPRILVNGGDLTPANDMSLSFTPPPTLSIPLVNSDFTLADMIEADAQVIEVLVGYHLSYTWKFGPSESNQPPKVDTGNVVIKIQPTSVDGRAVFSEMTPRVAVEVVTDPATGDMSIVKVGLWEELKQDRPTWPEMTYEPAMEGECDSAMCRLMDEITGWGSVAGEWGSAASGKVSTWGQKIGEKVKGCHKPKPVADAVEGDKEPHHRPYHPHHHHEHQEIEDLEFELEEPSWTAIVLTWITFTVLASIVAYGLGCLSGIILSPFVLLICFVLCKLFGIRHVRDDEEQLEGGDSGKGLLADQEAPPVYEEGVEVDKEKQ